MSFETSKSSSQQGGREASQTSTLYIQQEERRLGSGIIDCIEVGKDLCLNAPLRVCWFQNLHHWNANFFAHAPILLKHGSF